MSFILDALRKSDQDRQRTTVPGVQTMHAPATAADKRGVWPYATLIAVAMAGVGFLLWPEPQTSLVAMSEAPMHQPEKAARLKPQPSAQAANAPAPSPPPVVSPEPRVMKPEPVVEASQPSETSRTSEIAEADQAELEEPVEWIEISPQAPAEGTSENIAEAVDEPMIPNVHALPASVQRQLPAIAIAAQIYDSDPASRMALINGRSVREGGAVAPGLILETIAEERIVLNFQGQRFHMDVFQNWSGN